ncbi:MAG: tetratricopeptide repeat protein, partial [Merismopedia sp. SIO2A8]|nr:tetratricopeptide repeat protein [Merismopedia sp. SIO2A8]
MGLEEKYHLVLFLFYVIGMIAALSSEVRPVLWLLFWSAILLGASYWCKKRLLTKAFREGQSIVSHKDYAQGIRHFSLFLRQIQIPPLQRFPQMTAFAHESRGYCHFHLQHYEEAIADLSKALDSKQPLQDQSLVYEYRSNAYFELGDEAAAIADAQRLEKSPRFAWTCYYLADTNLNHNFYGDALWFYNKGLALQNNTRAYFQRGKAYHGLRRYTE